MRILVVVDALLLLLVSGTVLALTDYSYLPSSSLCGSYCMKAHGTRRRLHVNSFFVHGSVLIIVSSKNYDAVTATRCAAVANYCYESTDIHHKSGIAILRSNIWD